MLRYVFGIDGGVYVECGVFCGMIADETQLLRHFDFQVVDPTKPWDSMNYALFMQRNMWTSVTLRRGV